MLSFACASPTRSVRRLDGIGLDGMVVPDSVAGSPLVVPLGSATLA